MNKKIKLVLMSAALDIKLFVEYFGHCPVINGKLSALKYLGKLVVIVSLELS